MVQFPGQQVGAGNIHLAGTGASPSDVVLSSTGAATLEINGAWAILSNMRIQNIGMTGQDALHASWNARVWLDRLEFSQAAFAQIDVDTGAEVWTAVNYSIVGPAKAHIATSLGGRFVSYGGVANIVGNPMFNHFVQATQGGIIQNLRGNFTGTARGVRYYVSDCSIICAARGPNFFPGNQPGVHFNGGFYD